MSTILLIDDEEDFTDYVRADLVRDGHKVECVDSAEPGMARLGQGSVDVVLLDYKLPGMDGLQFLQELGQRRIDVPVVMITGFDASDTHIRAIQLRAFDYVIKPDDTKFFVAAVRPIIKRALAHTRPPRVLVAGEPKPAPEARVLVGHSRPMQEVRVHIAKLAHQTCRVLILGETGTGKEMVAQALYTYGPRKDKPFYGMNCTAFNDNTLESELFGYVPGAFTGANKVHKGKFEYANGGTLFLDEIGDMEPKLQAKILRVLEEKEVVRMGSHEAIKVDVRVISATHADLETAIEQGRFRRDLYHRLTGEVIHIPPLRDRLDDLPLLVKYILERVASTTERLPPEVAPETWDLLRGYAWPGNIRELENVVGAAFRNCEEAVLRPHHLRLTSHGSGNAAANGEAGARCALRKAIAWAFDTNQENLSDRLGDMLKEELVREALRRCDGNQTEAAKRLYMNRGAVVKRVKEYGLRDDQK